MSKRESETEGGHSSPPPFFDPHAEIHRHTHRLPHWQQGEVFYFVTWRLADALPQAKLDEWREVKTTWLHSHPEPWDATTAQEYHQLFSRRIDVWLDAGSGSCALRDRNLAEVIARALRHFDGERYHLAAFVVMPNHVHALFRLVTPYHLEKVIGSWKGFTAREINRRLGRSGALWQENYWDRMIRHEEHFAMCRNYILENPLHAKLRGGEFVLFDAIERNALDTTP
ncbi:MAG TPA: transposase [Chthoniobacter sp.]|jgi:type I restriction enzyme R subunit